KHLQFDDLARPGTFILELIGGGKSSRAVIRKGGLRVLDRRTAAGHALTILDEQDRVIEAGASLGLGGREFVSGDAGEIRVPYGSIGAERALLRAGDRAAVVPLTIAAEHYELRGGVHVEREQLIAGSTAELVIATTLTLAGVPVPIELLRETMLRIESV